MVLLNKLSLPLAGLSVLLLTLFLLRWLDQLTRRKNKGSRLWRLGFGLGNGILAAYILTLYKGGTPTILLVLFLDLLYVLEYACISQDKLSAYLFFLSAVFLNNLMVYIMTYALYRALPLNRLNAAGELYQRLIFAIANAGCLPILALFQTKAFPARELRYIVHSRESLLLNIWLPVNSGLLALYGVAVLPLVQAKPLAREMEISVYIGLFLWALSSLLSSYIIALYQALRVRTRNSMETEVRKERKFAAKMKEQADIQPLTGLLNRRAWERKVRKALAEGKTGYMIMLDLDHFKEVNDNLGHMEGDLILKETADMLRQVFRKTDFIGHIGGDEFCIFLVNELERAIVEQRLDSLLSMRRKQYQGKRGDAFLLSFSAGCAETPLRGDGLDEFEKLLAAADTALYWQKENGRDGYTIYREGMEDVKK